MSRRNAKAMLMFASLVMTTAAWAAEPPAVRNNPFTRPLSAPTTDAPDASRVGWASGLVLTATMVSDAGSSVHIDGRVLRPGDEIFGYTLVRVLEDSAIFTKDGFEEAVFVKPNLDPNNEDVSKAQRRR